MASVDKSKNTVPNKYTVIYLPRTVIFQNIFSQGFIFQCCVDANEKIDFIDIIWTICSFILTLLLTCQNLVSIFNIRH